MSLAAVQVPRVRDVIDGLLAVLPAAFILFVLTTLASAAIASGLAPAWRALAG